MGKMSQYRYPPFFVSSCRSGVLAAPNPSGTKVALDMKATDRERLIGRIRNVEGLTEDERAELIKFLSEKNMVLFGKIRQR